MICACGKSTLLGTQHLGSVKEHATWILSLMDGVLGGGILASVSMISIASELDD